MLSTEAYQISSIYNRAENLKKLKSLIIEINKRYYSEPDQREELMRLAQQRYNDVCMCLPNDVATYDSELYKQLGTVIHFMQLIDGGNDKHLELANAATVLALTCLDGIEVSKEEMKELINRL